MKYDREDARIAVGSHWPRTDDGKIDGRACWPALDVGDGWSDVVVLAVRLGEAINPNFVLLQVKEKFGGLRFYSDLPDVTEIMIENLAVNVCEICGEVGVLRFSDGPGPWLKTLCEDHMDTGYGQYLSKGEWKDKYEPVDGR